jgi:hypothetical protein
LTFTLFVCLIKPLSKTAEEFEMKKVITVLLGLVLTGTVGCTQLQLADKEHRKDPAVFEQSIEAQRSAKE